MTILNIKEENNTALFSKAEPVTDITSEDTQKLIDDLIETSKLVGGYGLAAPQVEIPKQVFVYRKSVDTDRYFVVINPEIIVKSGKLISKNEGCLSHPGFRSDIKRYKTFILTGYDREGNKNRFKGTTRKEIIILQHEYDHLMGVTVFSKGT